MVYLKSLLPAVLGALLLPCCATAEKAHDAAAAETSGGTTGFWQEFNREAAYDGPTRSGKLIYHNNCRGCHGKNTQGAPLPGDQAEWQPRLAKGMDVLMRHALDGYGELMPPRGGCRDCSDEELRAALVYMIELPEPDYEALQ